MKQSSSILHLSDSNHKTPIFKLQLSGSELQALVSNPEVAATAHEISPAILRHPGLKPESSTSELGILTSKP